LGVAHFEARHSHYRIQVMRSNQVIIKAFTELSPRYEQVVDGELKKFWGWSYEGFIDNLINLSDIQNKDIVLDVATGTGVIPLRLSQKGKTDGKIIGLDITQAMLHRAQAKIKEHGTPLPVELTCASAMSMPYKDGYFDAILCGLATHHLDVPVVLAEMYRVLKPGGRLNIADVGGSASWRLPGVNGLIRLATFTYFLPKEGYARAKSEANALFNVLSGNEWKEKLEQQGFVDISITNLPTSHPWFPTPLVIRSHKVSQ
jgi:ubiquinone/menaquinone biosynthesis C-methylase UbiE